MVERHEKLQLFLQYRCNKLYVCLSQRPSDLWPPSPTCVPLSLTNYCPGEAVRGGHVTPDWDAFVTARHPPPFTGYPIRTGAQGLGFQRVRGQTLACQGRNRRMHGQSKKRKKREKRRKEETINDIGSRGRVTGRGIQSSVI